MAAGGEQTGSSRPFAPAQHARRHLGIDPRTARDRIRNYVEGLDGLKIEGYIVPGKKLDGYFFYLDSIEPDPAGEPTINSSATGQADDEVAQLRAQLADAQQTNARLQARLTDSDAARRELLAAKAMLIDGVEDMTAGSAQYQKGVAQITRVLGIYRNQLAAHLSPDDLSSLGDLPSM
ncbi:hypothetical protein [Mycobacteroides abscessus]|uniref:hypothetical protein n=1 Tax=Mycobacteroides abscessus TaxID=36809 RepID=UPI000C2577B0|nr:hypothetical protein [Mycobacteroides abscessus]